MRASWAAAALSVLPLVWQTARCEEFNPHASVTSIWTDNALGFHDHPLTEETLDAMVGLGVVEDTQRFHVNADAGFLHRQFLRGDLPSENLPNASVTATAAIVPERLVWSFEDRLGQISTESFESLSMADRQNVNYLSTGPDAYFNFGTRNILRVNGRFGVTDFSSSNIDSNRYSGLVSLGRYLTPSAILSVNYRYENIKYRDSDIYPAIKSGTEYLSYNVQSSRMFFVIEAGVATLQPDNTPSKSAPHALIGLQRTLTPRVTLNMEYTHDFSDVGELVRSDVLDQTQAGQAHNVLPAASAFVVDRAYIMLVRSGSRLLAAFQVNWQHEQYEDDILAQNRKLYGADLVMSYRLTPVWTAEAHGQWNIQEQQTADPREHYLNLSVGVTRRIGRGLQVALALQRSQNSGVLTSDDITENRVTIGVTWAPHAPQLPIFGAASQFRFYERSPQGGMAMPGR